MTRVLDFWRDVEIFNIPEVPTGAKPGRPGAASAAETVQYQGIDLDEDHAEQPDAEPSARPRSRLLQHFGIAPRQPDKPVVPSGMPRILPWADARFREVPQPTAPPAAPEKRRRKKPAQPTSYAHAVYVGVAPRQRFVDWILRLHEIAPNEDELHRPATGEGWLAAFLADVDGVPIAKTYVAAAFAAGSALLRASGSLDSISAELRQRSADFDERMARRIQRLTYKEPENAPFPLQWEDVVAEWRLVEQQAGGDADADDGLAPLIAVESIPLYEHNGVLDPKPEQAAAFLNSFFLEDLTTLLQKGPDSFSPALRQYLGEDSAPESRQDLLANPAAHVVPGFMPAGRWPASPAEHLSLAQQAAVYQVFEQIGQADGDHARGLMTVNGPPGTGKTTLLKEIFADVVVQRAHRLSTLRNPGELFDGRTVQVTGGDQLVAKAVRPDIVADSGIVVSSNNNAAVKNISLDLPFSCDLDTFPEAAYLPEVAMLVAELFNVKNGQPWGLLSGTLGARANCEKIAGALMGYEDAVVPHLPETHPVPGEPSSLKPWLDYVRRRIKTSRYVNWQQRWNDIRDDFTSRYAAVEACRARLAAWHEAMADLPRVTRECAQQQAALDAACARLSALQAAESSRMAEHARLDEQDQAGLQAVQHLLVEQRRHKDERLARLQEIRDMHQPGWATRALKKILGVETRGYQVWKQEMAQAHAAIDAAAAALHASEDERRQTVKRMQARHADNEAASLEYAAQHGTISGRIASLRQSLEQLAARMAELQARIASIPLAGSGAAFTVPDADFMALPAHEQHRRSLWLSRDLEQARSELFLCALRLHEASLMANASDWFSLLRVVRAFLRGQALPRSTADLEAIWQALFFVVPVVSTTLASFGRLFQGMGSASLGWVMVDEAGQATAASVAGALWRARRAILVGDPLQIEPVVTVPAALVEKLAAHNGLEDHVISRWSPVTQSAQTIGDRTMRLGASVSDVWTGLPLRTHRRCMEPMFTIANRIAYEGQMVQATRPKAVAPDLHASCWIDVYGKATDKVVHAEIAALCAILRAFVRDWPQVIDHNGKQKPASVYIISPFRNVAQACKDLLRDDDHLGRQQVRRKYTMGAGTVHTFQGKEASIVFMVLGSAPGDAGARSRSWAAAKPNLLNVAVTRAQQRFYVIGNYDEWTCVPYFAELAEEAGHMPRMRIEETEDRQIRLVPASGMTADSASRPEVSQTAAQ